MSTVAVNVEATERARLEALARYGIMDSPREKDFDDIAQLASEICGTPIAVVNLIGESRQFFKAEVGLGVRETPFGSSFCAKAILEDEFLMVPDATKDHRFDCNPLVTGDPHLRFYAGAVLKTPDNLPIGTVCVLDYEPRVLNEMQQRTLRVLAKQVMAQLDLRQALQSEANSRRLAQSGEARYRAVFESAVDYAIVVLDLGGLVTDWNEGANRILGWSREEAFGQHVSLFFTPEDRAEHVADVEMSNALARGRGADERWYLRKGGERFWANGEMMPLQAADGSTVGFIKILRDRTAQRVAEDQVKASEKRWRELFENMGEGFFLGELIRDGHGRAVDYRFMEINPAFMELLGLSATCVGKTIRDLSTHIPQWLIERFALTVDTGVSQSFEFFVTELDLWLEVRSKKETGESFSALFFDITGRKEAEALLVESEERLKVSLGASGGVGIWNWMLESELIHGDANFAAMYGLNPEKTASGVTVEEYQKFVNSDDLQQLNEKIRDVFELGADFVSDYRIAVPGKDVRWVECKGKLVQVDGKPPRFSGTAVDITAIKYAEQQKQLLMEEMAHRVKNTFSVVQAIASQSLRQVDPAASTSFFQRLAALGNAHNVLLQTNWEATDIHYLVERILLPQTGSERFELSGPDITLGSRTALSLSLLLHEMATNAVKYGALSVDGGKVEVHWSIETDVFKLTWREVGGPPATPPARRGFGSRLISLGINGARNVHLDFCVAGLYAVFTAPASSLT
ncbi:MULTISPECIES: PAS domain S-box protein [unclassified Rhizobium]|uniref:PAS domain S-box protein n=1 Tax=unclassified Rhizobium TaxID=2613769 RepID=UPI001FFE01C0|nr:MULTISPECIES: PAS domain S-box protein [unclassified Rhizobium]